MKLLAVSMRVAAETAYPEARDAVARDWWRFLHAALPDHLPVLLPNDAAYARALLSLNGISGLLLTGGNDIGTCPARDEAEAAAFEAARACDLPVLGICRGMQLLAHLHGARIVRTSAAQHVATRHALETDLPGSPTRREVNSFHGMAVELSPGSPMRVRARSVDGGVEAIELPGDGVLGIMWHPEREAAPDPADLALFARLFDGQRTAQG